jgi:exosortase B
MNQTLPLPGEPTQPIAPRVWVFGILSFLMLYGPLYYEASQNLWQRDEHAHGPMILIIALWLIWRLHGTTVRRETLSPLESTLGWSALGLGVLTYALGRALSFSVFEFGSQLLFATGVVTLMGGWAALRILWFPLVFLVFMIPLPGAFVDSITGVLKQWVSVWAEHILALGGYPIGRQGVTLVIGQYQMLVADACSGMHSMFTLASMGLLFMYLKGRSSWVHNGVMMLSILPIAFLANIIRVIALVLITYHLGDEAGQGFLHGAAGVLLMVIALLTFIAVDWLLHHLFRGREQV